MIYGLFLFEWGFSLPIDLFFKPPYNNEMKNAHNKGFMLVQVMIAFGLVAALALVITSLMDEMKKTQKLSEIKNEELALIGQITSYISNEDICTNAFSAFRPGDTFEILQFTRTGEGTVLEVGEELGNTGLIIESLEILPDVTHFTNDLWEITFRLTMKKKEGDYYMAGTSKSRDFRFVAQLCEPIVDTYTTGSTYSNLQTSCANQASSEGAQRHWVEPPNYNPMAGPFICYICSEVKTILSCQSE